MIEHGQELHPKLKFLEIFRNVCHVWTKHFIFVWFMCWKLSFLNKTVEFRCTVQCDGLISFALFASFQRKNWKAIRRRTEQKCLEGHCQFPFVLVISAALFLSSYQPQLSSTPLHNVRICQIQSDFILNNAKKCYPTWKIKPKTIKMCWSSLRHFSCPPPATAQFDNSAQCKILSNSVQLYRKLVKN